jgi:hypothetical protein
LDFYEILCNPHSVLILFQEFSNFYCWRGKSFTIDTSLAKIREIIDQTKKNYDSSSFQANIEEIL